jgi:hypothetical protein
MSSYLLSSPQDFCSDYDVCPECQLFTPEFDYGAPLDFERHSCALLHVETSKITQLIAGRRQDCHKVFRGRTLLLTSRCVPLLNQTSVGFPSMKYFAHSYAPGAEPVYGSPATQSLLYCCPGNKAIVFSEISKACLPLFKELQKFFLDCKRRPGKGSRKQQIRLHPPAASH